MRSNKKKKAVRRSAGVDKSGERLPSCASCGVLIHSDTSSGVEPLCLICHARILNEYFQETRKRTEGEPRPES
jgi:hypothetical protein